MDILLLVSRTSVEILNNLCWCKSLPSQLPASISCDKSTGNCYLSIHSRSTQDPPKLPIVPTRSMKDWEVTREFISTHHSLTEEQHDHSINPTSQQEKHIEPTKSTLFKICREFSA